MTYNNYLNRDDCIDHGLHMTECDDDDHCDHCNTCDDAEAGPVFKPGGALPVGRQWAFYYFRDGSRIESVEMFNSAAEAEQTMWKRVAARIVNAGGRRP